MDIWTPPQFFAPSQMPVMENHDPMLYDRSLTMLTSLEYGETMPSVGARLLGMDRGPNDGKYTRRAFHTALGPAQKLENLSSPLPRDTPVISDAVESYYEKFGLAYEWLDEEVDDHLFPVVVSNVKSLGQSMRYAEEVADHKLLNNATDASFTGGWDGLTLFNAAHPLLKSSITVNNLFFGGGPSVQMINNIMDYGDNFVSQEGYPTPIKPVLLVTGPSNARLWRQYYDASTNIEQGNPAVPNPVSYTSRPEILETQFLARPFDTYVFYEGYQNELLKNYKYKARTRTYTRDEPLMTVHLIEGRWTIFWTSGIRIVRIPGPTVV